MFGISFWEWIGVFFFGVLPLLVLIWSTVWVLRRYNADLKTRREVETYDRQPQPSADKTASDESRPHPSTDTSTDAQEAEDG